MLREANVPVRRLCRPTRSGTPPEAAIVGSLSQKLLKVSVSNLTSTLGTFAIASAAELSPNWGSSSVAVQKNQRSETFCPLAAAGACCAATVGLVTAAAGCVGAAAGCCGAAQAAASVSAALPPIKRRAVRRLNRGELV